MVGVTRTHTLHVACYVSTMLVGTLCIVLKRPASVCPRFGSTISKLEVLRGLQNRTNGLELSPKSTGSLERRAFGSYGERSFCTKPLGELFPPVNPLYASLYMVAFEKAGECPYAFGDLYPFSAQAS